MRRLASNESGGKLASGLGGGRIPELDGIRGLAVGMVVFYHYFYVMAVAAPGSFEWHLLAPLRLGWSGVDLFFVLSGFLIGGILIDAKEAKNYFKTFYTRRFFRIVPLYTAMLCIWLGIVVSWRIASPARSWLLYPLFLQNFWMAVRNSFGTPFADVSWSLAVEEQFYLMLPLLVALLTARQFRRIVSAMVVAAPLLRTAIYFLWPSGGTAIYVMMPCRMDSLLLGVLAAIAMRDPKTRAWIEQRPRLTMGATLALFCGCIALSHYESRPISETMAMWGYTWVALFYTSLLVSCLTHGSSIVARVMRARWLCWLGQIAYGVYLTHMLALWGITELVSPGQTMRREVPALDSWRQLIVTLASLGLTLGICRISWKWFEKPLIQVGHRAKYELGQSAILPAAAEIAAAEG